MSAEPYPVFPIGALSCIRSMLQGGEVGPICKEMNASVWLLAVSRSRSPGRENVSLIWGGEGENFESHLPTQFLASLFLVPYFSHFSHMSEEWRGMIGLSDCPVFALHDGGLSAHTAPEALKGRGNILGEEVSSNRQSADGKQGFTYFWKQIPLRYSMSLL